MFVGKHDILATVKDAAWARDQIGSDVFLFQVVDGGHFSFLFGKDMSYFTEDAMSII